MIRRAELIIGLSPYRTGGTAGLPSSGLRDRDDEPSVSFLINRPMEITAGTQDVGIGEIVGSVKWLSWLEDQKSTPGQPEVAPAIEWHSALSGTRP